MSPRFAIVADDLTGAADTAVGFLHAGFDAVVTWGGVHAFEALDGDVDLVAVSTETRRGTPGDARAGHRARGRGGSANWLHVAL